MATRDRPLVLAARWATAEAGGVPGRVAVAPAGLGAGLITGNKLETFPAGIVVLETGLIVGTGPSVGTTAGVGATAGAVTGGDVTALGDEGEGAGLLGAFVGLGALAGMAVTVTVPVATA
jgi:hypothetical protein